MACLYANNQLLAMVIFTPLVFSNLIDTSVHAQDY